MGVGSSLRVGVVAKAAEKGVRRKRIGRNFILESWCRGREFVM